jgi:hypothetical protein
VGPFTQVTNGEAWNRQAISCETRSTMPLRDEHEHEELAGARPRGIVRIGDTVRRPPAEAPLAAALLRHLEAVGFEGAPRLLGSDELGREVLSFLPGDVLGERPPVGAERLESAARLIRRFHDATFGSAVAGGEEVVCHGELGPHNTLFVGDEAVALIDFDTVYTGRRVDDLDHAAWFFVPIADDGGALDAQGRRLRLFCDAYGGVSPEAVLSALAERFERARAWYLERALERGAAIFAGYASWLAEHRDAILAAAR